MLKRVSFSENCPIAVKARRGNKVVRWLLKNIGRKVCPFCKAYEREHGKAAYE